jgi:hypothetical protein
VLAVFAASFVALFSLGIYINNFDDRPVAAVVGSSVFAAVALVLFASLGYFARKIEGLDTFAWQFDEARMRLLKDVPTDERGLASFRSVCPQSRARAALLRPRLEPNGPPAPAC